MSTHPTPTKECKVCGKAVPARRSVFCSAVCQRKYHDHSKFRNRASDDTELLQQYLTGSMR